MTDLLPTVPLPPVHHHTAEVATTVVTAVAPIGETMSASLFGDYVFTAFVSVLVGIAIGAVASWYYGKSSTATTVNTDVSALQADITSLKTKVGL